MKIHTITPRNPQFPERLRHIDSPPARLYVLGNVELLRRQPALAIVGSRALTPYGKQITDQLASAAAAQGIAIVSGLALGVDGIAHRAAIQAGGPTIAVLANGLDYIHPRSHRELAKELLACGGVIISEYPEGTAPYRYNFIARNRLVSGLSDAVLITEAAEKSGSLHTAQFALEQGREVMAVPGAITSPMSKGTNQLIKTGATPITDAQDILDFFGVKGGPAQLSLQGATAEEQLLLELLGNGVSEGGELLARTGLSAPVFNQTLTMLELTGRVKALGAGRWGLS